MPIFDWAYHQRCIAANDFSTIATSATSTQFDPIVYEAARLCSPASSTSARRSSLKRSRTSPGTEFKPSDQPPRKRAKRTMQTPTTTTAPPIRLRLTHPHPSPTGIKPRLRNLVPTPAAKQEPRIKLRLRNPAAKPAPAVPPGRKPNKVWAFRFAGEEWCAATNDENEAQWLREVFACGSWVRGMQEAPPTTKFLGPAAGPDDGGWQREGSSWEMELRPEDAWGEGGGGAGAEFEMM